jgi:hypothetical protein
MHIYFDQDPKYGIKSRDGWFFGGSPKLNDVMCGSITQLQGHSIRSHRRFIHAADSNNNAFINPGQFATCNEVKKLFQRAEIELNSEQWEQDRWIAGHYIPKKKEEPFDPIIQDKDFKPKDWT